MAEIIGETSNTWERRLWVGPNNTFVTKTRAVPGRELPEVIRNPNLGQIVGYLLGLPGIERPEGVEMGLTI